jgi:hypothetical protein
MNRVWGLSYKRYTPPITASENMSAACRHRSSGNQWQVAKKAGYSPPLHIISLQAGTDARLLRVSTRYPFQEACVRLHIQRTVYLGRPLTKPLRPPYSSLPLREQRATLLRAGFLDDPTDTVPPSCDHTAIKLDTCSQ